MPRSATGATDARRRVAGLGLVELLVVMAILAALAGGLVLAMPDLASRRDDNEAARFQGLMDLACQRAAATGRDVGIALARDRVVFGHLEAGAFVPMVDGPAESLRPRALSASRQWRASAGGRPLALDERPPEVPQLACLASGERVPFVVTLERDGVARWRIEGGAVGALSREPVDAR